MGVRRAPAPGWVPRGGANGGPRRALHVRPVPAFRIAGGVARLPRPGGEGPPGRPRARRGPLRRSEVMEGKLGPRDDTTFSSQLTAQREELAAMRKQLVLYAVAVFGMLAIL